MFIKMKEALVIEIFLILIIIIIPSEKINESVNSA